MTKANSNHIEKPGYQLTKLGWIPEDWEIIKGSDLTKKITKGSSPNWQGFKYTNKGTLFVTSENVREGFLDISSPKYLPIEFNKKQSSSVLEKGDLLINIVGASIGRSCRYDSNLIANINQAVALFRLKKDFNSIFILQYLNLPQTVRRLIEGQSDGARPNLSLTDLKLFKFAIPPLPEQQKIATILSTWDKAIQKQEALIAKKLELKKGLMQQLLTGKLRFPEFVKSTKTKKTKLGEIPEDWELLTVSKLFKFLPTNSFSRAQMNHEYSYDSVFNIHYGDIHATYDHVLLDLDKNDTLVPVLENDLKYNQDAYLKDGDLIVADASEDYKGVGDCIELKNVRGRKVLSGLHTIALRDLTGRTVDGFRAYCLKNSPVAKNLMKLATGSKVHGISKASISRLEILLPSKEEQQKIASVLTQADKEIKKLRQQLEQLKTQKKGLMQQLLTGQIRVKTKQYAHEKA